MNWMMRVMFGVVVISAGLTGHAQTSGAAAPTGAVRVTDGEGAFPVATDTRTEKQKALAKKTEQLFELATELKVQVDRTNKNILSLRVVEDAEQLEKLAKGMRENGIREQARR